MRDALVSVMTQKIEFPRPMRRAALGLTLVLAPLTIALAGTLYFGTVAVNGSHSLRGNGFVLFAKPRLMIRGFVVQVPAPAAFAQIFGDAPFLKRIAALPGDPVSLWAGADGPRWICFRARCVGAHIRKDGTAVSDLMPAGRIPEGAVALLGDSPDSLDSRYAEVGLWPVSQIAASGITIPGFPSREVLKRWAD